MAIHNLAFQGVFSPETVTQLGLPSDKLRYQRGGILWRHVLPKGRALLFRPYRHRKPDLCQGNPDCAAGLWHGRLAASRREHISGIVNGIPTENGILPTIPILRKTMLMDDLAVKSANKMACSSYWA